MTAANPSATASGMILLTVFSIYAGPQSARKFLSGVLAGVQCGTSIQSRHALATCISQYQCLAGDGER
jgi:hypothetical protein